jgi:membrane fusion protein, adhesin transport system
LAVNTAPTAGRPSRLRLDQLRGSRLIITASAVGFAMFLVWATIARVDEVSRGEGRVIPSSKQQVITAAEPGTISQILVRTGQTVRKDQLLVQMDDSQSSSQLGQVEAETQMLTARAARLGQEGVGGGAVGCPEEVQRTNPSACQDEAVLQRVRAGALNSKLASLSAVIDQKRSELQQAQADAQSLTAQVASAREKRELIRPAVANGTLPRTDLNDANRTVDELEGRLNQTRARIPGIEAAIRQAQADASQANLAFRQEALDQKNQLQAKIAVNTETLKGAESKVQKGRITAPMDGVVNDVQVTTLGAYVNAGQKILEVVPLGDKLLVEARVQPRDIAFIKNGDRATVKVSAYDFSIYGGLPGRVVNVSADSIYDEQKREAYFTILVETDKAFLKSGSRQLPITPGMVTTVDVITGNKSVLSYLLKPVLRAKAEALRER